MGTRMTQMQRIDKDIQRKSAQSMLSAFLSAGGAQNGRRVLKDRFHLLFLYLAADNKFHKPFDGKR
jgi:hypothetical protein